MFRTFLAPIAAAIAAYFLDQVWWLRALEGAAIGAVAFVAIPAAINLVAERNNVAILRVDCLVDFLPMRLPAEGRVLVVQLFSNAETPHQAGQSMLKYGDPGMLTGWPQGAHAYRCEVRSVNSSVTLFDMAITLNVEFREAVKQTPSAGPHAGSVVQSGAVSVMSNRLDEKAPFVFLITNSSPHYAAITGISVAFANPKPKDPRLTISQTLSDIPASLPPYGI